MKVLFIGIVLKQAWPGGESRVARVLENAFSDQGMQVAKCFLPRDCTPLWRFVKPWTAQTILDNRIVGMYRRRIEKIQPDVIMTWFDFDLSAFWAGVLSGIPTIAQAQILWPVCPLFDLFNEITQSPCDGPSKSCGLCMVMRAKFIGQIPSVAPSVACLPFTQLSMMKIRNLRSKLGHASAIISDSRFLKTMMNRVNYDVGRVHVIYNGIDMDPLKPATLVNKQKIVLFLSNQIIRQKGVYHFMELSKKLKPEFPNVRFLWVGQTEVYGDSFETLGYVWDKEKLQEIFQSSYLLLLPSLWPEPMSYAVIQAMTHGKPVVAYDVGANSEAIVHGETGLLAEWGNIEQLTSHVRTLLTDEGLAAGMGLNARKRAEEKFSLKKMTRSYVNLLEEFQHCAR